MKFKGTHTKWAVLGFILRNQIYEAGNPLPLTVHLHNSQNDFGLSYSKFIWKAVRFQAAGTLEDNSLRSGLSRHFHHNQKVSGSDGFSGPNSVQGEKVLIFSRYSSH
jgi:hypothetical protein